MDCEMVGVGEYGLTSTPARVTIVNWDGHVVYDQCIRPTEPVTDYRTFVSGITAADLESESAVDLEQCRARVAKLIGGKTLVGHALKNDLTALQLHHPWQYTRDTAKYEPFMKQRFDNHYNNGVLWPRKLKELMWEHLELEIQPLGRPHSAHEDAYAAMRLYQAVRPKWEKVMEYKIRKTADIVSAAQQGERLCRPPPNEAPHAVNEAWPALVSMEGEMRRPCRSGPNNTAHAVDNAWPTLVSTTA